MNMKNKIKFNFPHVSEYEEKGKIGTNHTKLYDDEGNIISDEENNIKSNVGIKPMCIRGNMNLAVTNRGQLLPCCKCDTHRMMKDPEFKKLVDNSYLTDYNSVNDILNNDYYKAFQESLERNRCPFACWDLCRTNKEKGRQEMTVAVKGELKIWERK